MQNLASDNDFYQIAIKKDFEEEEVVKKDKGKEIEIGFNSKYILEMINQLDEEKLILEFCDSTSPLIVKESSNNDLIYVLMPMHV